MKKILFVIDELNMGGAQKSLINLLKIMDYKNYQVDMIMFRKKGILENELPKEVHKIELCSKDQAIFVKAKESIKKLIRQKHYQQALKRILGVIQGKLRTQKLNLTQLLWKQMGKYVEERKEKYDVAIGYLEGIATYYVVDKIKADKKIVWMHTDYKESSYDRQYDEKYFNKVNKIFHVSEQSLHKFIEVFPQFSSKVEVMHNTLDKKDILEKAEEKEDYMNDHEIQIVTIGRLEKVKGYDLAICALEKLIKQDYFVKWYVVGDGSEKENLKKLVKQKSLQHNFIFLGTQKNPYKYINKCNIYVQPSLVEGYCITLLEAKVLNKIIVTTNFSGASEQIKNKITGSIVEMNAEAIFKGIKELIDNQELGREYQKNLKQENMEINEIEKLYKAIEK